MQGKPLVGAGDGRVWLGRGGPQALWVRGVGQLPERPPMPPQPHSQAPPASPAGCRTWLGVLAQSGSEAFTGVQRFLRPWGAAPSSSFKASSLYSPKVSWRQSVQQLSPPHPSWGGPARAESWAALSWRPCRDSVISSPGEGWASAGLCPPHPGLHRLVLGCSHPKSHCGLSERRYSVCEGDGSLGISGLPGPSFCSLQGSPASYQLPFLLLLSELEPSGGRGSGGQAHGLSSSISQGYCQQFSPWLGQAGFSPRGLGECVGDPLTSA